MPQIGLRTLGFVAATSCGDWVSEMAVHMISKYVYVRYE